MVVFVGKRCVNLTRLTEPSFLVNAAIGTNDRYGNMLVTSQFLEDRLYGGPYRLATNPTLHAGRSTVGGDPLR